MLKKKKKYIGSMMSGVVHALETFTHPFFISPVYYKYEYYTHKDYMFLALQKNIPFYIPHFPDAEETGVNSFNYFTHKSAHFEDPNHNYTTYFDDFDKSDFSTNDHHAINYYGDRLVDLLNDGNSYKTIAFADQNFHIVSLESYLQGSDVELSSY